MDLELTGRVAIVTGASRGVGKAIPRELALEGVDVAICARNREAVEASAKELADATGRRIIPIVADTTSSESVRRLVDTTRAQLGGGDILGNNEATPGGVVRGPPADAGETAPPA